jgi:large subunit ribosomal protein L22
MEIKAKLKNLRMSPQKVRLVINLIRKMPIDKALDQLKFVQKQAAMPVSNLLKTAMADAEHNYNLDPKNLKIAEIRVDEGFTLKRWMPRAHGRATKIRKRSAHISLTLQEIVASGKKEARKVEAEKPVKLEEMAKDVNKKTDKKVEKEESKKGSDKAFSSKVFRRKSG